jgi:PAS domain S-box-containing protein
MGMSSGCSLRLADPGCLRPRGLELSMDENALALLAATLEHAATGGVVLLDADGAPLHANAAARAIFGVDAAGALLARLPAQPLGAALAQAGQTSVAVNLATGAALLEAIDLQVRALRGADQAVVGYLLQLALPAPQVPPGAARLDAVSVDAVWLWDIASGREIYSREWKAMLGFADTEVGDSAEEWRTRVHPDDLAPALAAINRARQPTANGFQIDHRLRHRNGEWRWIRSRGHVVERDAQGEALRMVGIDRDISEIRELQLQLDEREGLLAMAERLSGLGYWTWDPASDHVRWSAGMYRAFGLPAGGAPPSFAQHRELMAADSHARLDRAVRAALERGEAYSIDIELRRPDGSCCHAIAVGEPVHDARGNVLRLWGVLYDVTEQRARGLAAQRQAALLEQVSRIGRIGGWSLQTTSGALAWTEGTYRIHDLDPGEPVDVERALSFYLPRSRARIAAAVAAAIDHGRAFDLEAQVRTASGRDLWVRAMGEAEPGDDGKPRVSGVFQDVTAAKLAELRLAQTMEDLRARNRELQDFAAAASHDLQEPLRKIQTFGSLLVGRAAGELDAQSRDWLGRMTAAAARMSELVGDVLAYSKVSSGPEIPDEVDMAAIGAAVVGDLEALIAASGGEVRIEPLPALRADPTQMRQLLQNLIGNALKYRDVARTPRVRVSAAIVELPAVATGLIGPHCRIEVADNGIGFDNRYAEQIFAPFQRLHDRSHFDGTGMGLAIVRRIAERHGGRAHARATPGAGAVFTVDIPLERLVR